MSAEKKIFGSLRSGFDFEQPPTDTIIPFGVESFDKVSAIPKGGLITIVGQDGVGKTTLSLIVASGLIAALMDFEHSLDPAYAKSIAPDLIICRPESAEDGLTIAKTLLPAVDLLIIDSLAAVTEPDGMRRDYFIRLFLRSIANQGTTIIVIDQLRQTRKGLRSSSTDILKQFSDSDVYLTKSTALIGNKRCKWSAKIPR